MEDLNHSNENYGCVLVICNPQIEEKIQITWENVLKKEGTSGLPRETAALEAVPHGY